MCAFLCSIQCNGNKSRAKPSIHVLYGIYQVQHGIEIEETQLNIPKEKLETSAREEHEETKVECSNVVHMCSHLNIFTTAA